MNANIIVNHLDHLVLTVANIENTVSFYTTVLGMRARQFGEGRTALTFCDQKINLHLLGHEYLPKAANPTPGSADLCFLTNTPITDILALLTRLAIPVEQGPVRRTGATGDLLSVYLRDPDGNLIEVSNSLKDEV